MIFLSFFYLSGNASINGIQNIIDAVWPLRFSRKSFFTHRQSIFGCVLPTYIILILSASKIKISGISIVYTIYIDQLSSN